MLPCQVRTGLFLGSYMDQEDAGTLQNLGITHILQVGAELTPSHPEMFQYKSVRMYDMEDEDLLVKLQTCCSFIEGARIEGAVLVHCMAGVSRSASVVIGYLMWRDSLSFDQSLQAVKAVRPFIKPNQGFVKQLAEYERLGCQAPIKEHGGGPKQCSDVHEYSQRWPAACMGA